MSRKEITLAHLIENFFMEHLIQEKKVSSHTISSYRDMFRLLIPFICKKTKKKTIALELEDFHVERILEFLKSLEDERKCSVRSRNQRLAAIKSFFKHANRKCPDRAELIHRVLAISSKRRIEKLIDHLEREEVSALLRAPDRNSWIGR